MPFPSKSGCPMCGIVARASSSLTSPSPSPLSPVIPDSPASSQSQFQSRTRAATGKAREKPGNEPEIVWHDEHFTVYRERAKPVSSIAHLVIIFNLHVPSLYMLSASDVPLLVQLRDLAHRLLAELTLSGRTPSSPHTCSSPISPFAPARAASPSSATILSPPPPSSSSGSPTQGNGDAELASKFHVGFITPPWKDPSIPMKDHLHAHAYVAPMDRCSWWRSVAYGPLAWYAVEDLVAEIREESTNNRIRSSTLPSSPRNSGSGSGTGADHLGQHDNNTSNNGSDINARISYFRRRPIDRVPNAGARSGTASGRETTRESVAGLTLTELDLESGQGRRTSSGSGGRSSIGSGSTHGPSYTGYRDADKGNNGKSPLSPPTAARLAEPSRLDLNATYMNSGAYSHSYSMTASGSSTPTRTPTKGTFSIP